MKSLKIIQTLCKIARVICIIIFVLSIIGAAGCLIGIILMPALKDEVIYNHKTLEQLLEKNGTNFNVALTAMIMAFVVCGVSIFLSKYTELFFKKEIEVGTPFNKDIVRRMRVLGVVHIVTGILTTVIVSSVIAIAVASNPDVENSRNFNLSNVSSLWFGIAMLIISLFANYDVEKEEALKKESETNVIEEQPNNEEPKE